jgi:hypothetical protein
MTDSRRRIGAVVPEDIRAIPRPILSLFGGISAKTSDLALLGIRLIRCPPRRWHWSDRSRRCQRPRTCSNVRFLGKKPYEQIPHYGRCSMWP